MIRASGETRNASIETRSRRRGSARSSIEPVKPRPSMGRCAVNGSVAIDAAHVVSHGQSLSPKYRYNFKAWLWRGHVSSLYCLFPGVRAAVIRGTSHVAENQPGGSDRQWVG